MEPQVIEQHEAEADAAERGDLNRGIHVPEELGIEAGNSALTRPANAAAAVRKHEPARDLDPCGSHAREIRADVVGMRGHSSVAVPFVAAKVAAVIGAAVIDGPGVVDAGDHALKGS